MSPRSLAASIAFRVIAVPRPPPRWSGWTKTWVISARVAVLLELGEGDRFAIFVAGDQHLGVAQ